MILPVILGVLALAGGSAVESHRRTARRAQVAALTVAIRLAESTARPEDFERVAAMARPLGLSLTESEALRKAQLIRATRGRRGR